MDQPPFPLFFERGILHRQHALKHLALNRRVGDRVDFLFAPRQLTGEKFCEAGVYIEEERLGRAPAAPWGRKRRVERRIVGPELIRAIVGVPGP